MSKPTAPQLITDRGMVAIRRAKRQSSIKLRLATWELINELRTNFNTLGVRVQALEERTTALEYHCQVEPPEPLGYCQCPE
jgi:hypothetical protein